MPACRDAWLQWMSPNQDWTLCGTQSLGSTSNNWFTFRQVSMVLHDGHTHTGCSGRFLIRTCSTLLQTMDITDHAAVAASGSVPLTGFDRVLLDAPCSGTGVLAKRADLRWRRELSDLAGLTALQVHALCRTWLHASCMTWLHSHCAERVHDHRSACPITVLLRMFAGAGPAA